jgi:hypothetical protein
VSASSDSRLLGVDLPREVWSRGGRPLRSLVFRIFAALTLALAGIAMPSTAAALGMVALGVAVFFVVPLVVDGRLERLGETMRAADKSTAPGLLSQLESKRLVTMFAPFGWLELQRGRALLVQADGRGAARAFAECARMCRDPKNPVLQRAQARALLLAGDRKEARGLLVELEGRDKLDARGHLDLAIVYLADTGRGAKAQSHLDVAAKELGDLPQVTAARAAALAREGQLDDAAELVEQADADVDDDDPIAAELIKRARKLVKGGAAPAAGKGRKPGTAAAAPDPKGKKAKSKKDRRKERRRKRKEARASGKHPTVEAEVVQTEAPERVREPATAKPAPEPAPAKPEATNEPEATTEPEADTAFRARAEAPTKPERAAPSERAKPTREPAMSRVTPGAAKPAPPSAGSLFKPPPVPKVAAPPATATPRNQPSLFASKPTAPSLEKPAVPTIAAPPVVAPKPPKVAGSDDDGWGDLLGE